MPGGKNMVRRRWPKPCESYLKSIENPGELLSVDNNDFGVAVDGNGQVVREGTTEINLRTGKAITFMRRLGQPVVNKAGTEMVRRTLFLKAPLRFYRRGTKEYRMLIGQIRQPPPLVK